MYKVQSPLIRASCVSKSFPAVGNRILQARNQPAITQSHEQGRETVSILEDISLEVYSGEIVAIVGTSGVGKSTLLRLLAGIDKPDLGSSQIDTKGRIVWMPQETVLVSVSSAKRNAMLGARVTGTSLDEARIASEIILSELRLKEAIDMYPAQLSLGMKQRVALARTLAAKPNLAFLDEPISSLDVELRQHVSRMLRRYVMREHAAIVLVTHTIEEAVDYADRIYVLDGRPARVLTVAGRLPQTGEDRFHEIVSCKTRAELFTLVSHSLGVEEEDANED